jgi:hypothetical protein
MRHGTPSRRRPQSRGLLALEPLEDRLLLSLTPSLPVSRGPVFSEPITHQAAPPADTTPDDDSAYPAETRADSSTETTYGPSPSTTGSNDLDGRDGTEAYSEKQDRQGRDSSPTFDPTTARANEAQQVARLTISTPQPQASSATPSAAPALPSARADAEGKPADPATSTRYTPESGRRGPAAEPVDPPKPAPTNPPDASAEEHSTGPASPVEDPPSWVPGAGDLLAGAVNVDLARLEQAADQVFAQLESLAADVAAAPAGLTVTEWLVTASVAAAAFEMGRRRIKLPIPTCDPSLVFTLLPPEDET